MIAAIYARKSTEQNGAADDAKSVARQIANAREYAARKRWTVRDEHVYQDDGVSGVLFGTSRPGLARMLNALKPRPPFQILVMSEQSRLGREQIETGYVLKQIIDAGVRVFFYADDRDAVLDDPLQKMMLSLANFAAEMERDKARQRTHEAMLRKAKALHVTGGRVFGYNNIEVPGADGKRLYVVRRVHAEQADVVRRVFEMYAGGLGLVRIAKTLNAEGVPAPRTNGWAHTAIREMLYRELYAGVIIWNRTQKTVRAGAKKQRDRDEREWVRLDAPELRIVPDELWQAVRGRLEQSAARLPRGIGGHYKARHGQAPQGDGLARFLLTGFARCSGCGGALGGSTQLHGSGPASNRHRVSFYGCTYNRKRGPHVCANGTTIKTNIVDDALLDALTELLQARALDLAVDRAVQRLRAGREMHLDRRGQIERELSLIDARLARLVDAIANADAAVPTLIAKLKTEEDRKRSLARELESVQHEEAVAALDADDVRERVRKRAADLRGVLKRGTPAARAALTKLLVGKLDAEPVVVDGRRGYRLTGHVNVAGLLPDAMISRLQTGISNSPYVVAPRGSGIQTCYLRA